MRFGYFTALTQTVVVLVTSGVIRPELSRASQWSLAADAMCIERQFHTATLIGSDPVYAGKVLIIGGVDNDGQPTALVEMFDPESKTLTSCASLAQPRAYHTATWISDGYSGGKVLVVGGYTSCIGGPCNPGDLPALNTYELYDVAENCGHCLVHCTCTGTTSNALLLPDGLTRAEHTATVLSADLESGTQQVLIAGGTTYSKANALLFDPAFQFSDPWTTTAITIPPRFGHTATFVSPPGVSTFNSVVFIAGGSSQPLSGATPVSQDVIISPVGGATKLIEHDPDVGIPESRPARTHSASLFGGTHVLLWGGSDTTNPVDVDFSPIFNRSASLPSWTPFVPPASVAATNYAATLDATVVPSLQGTLIVGGLERHSCKSSGSSPYYAGANRWNPLVANLQLPRTNHTLTAIVKPNSLTAIVIGGSSQKGTGVCIANVQQTIETLTAAGQGQACKLDSDCLTNHCADGICCDQACSHLDASGTECQACNSAGFCKVADAGKVCTAPNACGPTACDGKSARCPAPASSQCGNPNGGAGGAGGTSGTTEPFATGGVNTASGGTTGVTSTSAVIGGSTASTAPDSTGGTSAHIASGGTSSTTEPNTATGGTTQPLTSLSYQATSSPSLVSDGKRDSFVSCTVAKGPLPSHRTAWLALSLLFCCRLAQRTRTIRRGS